MLIRAHIAYVPQEQLDGIVLLNKGDAVSLTLLTESEGRIKIDVDVSVVHAEGYIIRIEGATTHEGERAKFIAQLFRYERADSAGYAEIIPLK